MGETTLGGLRMIAYVEDRLAAEPEAVPRARHALAVELLPVVSEFALDTILLLSTEAVTRALRSTTSPWRLRVDAEEGSVRVSVEYEPDPTPPAPDSVGDAAEALRDELFVALSTTWGASEVGSAGTIWFEVPAV